MLESRYVSKIQTISNLLNCSIRFQKENSDVRFVFGPGLSWTSPLRDIKILYTNVAIGKLTATVRKDNTRKYLVLLHALHFNVSGIKRGKNNVNLSLQ